ncbi:MAG: ribonuclease J [Anaerolineae bacterium]
MLSSETAPAEPVLRVIPLGGVGEIGKNMMALECEGRILVIDAGLMFPDSEMPGVDIVIPDIEYLVERADQVEGIILTHGHEDHIGALPYVLEQLDVPVYGAPLTLGLAEVKLRQRGLAGEVDMIAVGPNDVLPLGPFTVEFFHVCHSIPDTLGVAVTTPVGLVIYSSDYKFDQHPADGRLTDFARLQSLGDRGVLLLLSDSTNAEKDGFTPSEQDLEESLEQLIRVAPGRVFLATFASNISRLNQMIRMAARLGRRVGLVGRSMRDNARMAANLGYLDQDPTDMLSFDQMNDLPGEQVIVVCTGSQGEPNSALVRMSMEEHRVAVRTGDTVIVSAVPIPGNEESVNRTIDNLFRLGANVLYHELAHVHVSGHGSREDHKMMFNLVRPQYFIPIHGEYRHLVLHSRLAAAMGVPQDHIFVIESGDVMEFGRGWTRQAEPVSDGHVLVDGSGVGDIGPVVLRDRRHLARDGFVVAIAGVDQATGAVVVEPEILSRGFIYMRDSEELIEQAKAKVLEALGHAGPPAAVASKIKDGLAELIYRRTGRRPMILPVVLEL